MAKLPPIALEVSPTSVTELVDKENPFEGTWGVLRALKAELREMQATLRAEQHMREDEVSKLRRELAVCREDLDRERRERKAEMERLAEPLQAEQERTKEELRKVKAARDQDNRETKERLDDETKTRSKDVAQLLQRKGVGMSGNVDFPVGRQLAHHQWDWVHQQRARHLEEEVTIWILGLAVLCAALTRLVRSKICFNIPGWSVRLASVMSCFFPDNAGKSDQELQAVVQQRSTELRTAQMCIAMQVTCVGLLPMTVGLLANVALGVGDDLLFTPAQEISIMVMQVVCALAVIKPALVVPARLDVIYLVLMLCCCLAVAPFTCCKNGGVIPSSMLTNIVVAVLSMLRRPVTCRELLLTTFGNALYTACLAWTRSLPENRDSPASSISVTSAQAVQLLVVMATSSVCEIGFRMMLSQGLQLAEARETYSAACALLRSCYDVVVQLDSLGCVDGPSLDLGSILLRSDGNRSMHGVRLADLIVNEEEREIFLRRLADPKMKTVGLAESMHMGMRDSLGNILSLEAMWFDFKGADGLRRFMVGIREFSDRFSDRAPPAWGFGSFEAPTDVQPVLAREEAMNSSSEDSMSQPGVLDGEDVLEKAMVVLDLGSGWRLRGVSSAFRSQVGHVPRNASLSSIVKKPVSMVKWIQNTVNAAANGEELPQDHRVVMRMPHGRVRALCRVVVKNTESLVVDDDNLVTILFHSISDGSTSRTPGRGSVGSGEVRGTPANCMIMHI